MVVDQPSPNVHGPAVVFPVGQYGPHTTCLILEQTADFLPRTAWVGVAAELGVPVESAAEAVTFAAAETMVPLLPEHWRGLLTRPGLRGFRQLPAGAGQLPAGAGTGWTTQFRTRSVAADGDLLVIDAHDDDAGLGLRTEVEALVGGSLRIRHRITNTHKSCYFIEGLEVVVPIPDAHDEVLDFTGRHERERYPQRRPITDGLWLREGRQGRTGLDAATMLVTGAAGFGFAGCRLLALHVAWSGNVLLRLERSGATGTTIGGGEHLLPGEVILQSGDSYETPWVHVVATGDGLDGVAAAFHQWLRSRPSHPTRVPVTLNVWEAVYFNHDLGLLKELATRAARIGVERFVLDDGWFHLRRNDAAGLGDWWVDPVVWPHGLGPLIEHVRGLGMEFGLWFEPEMVNRDSDLYRAHPDWILAAGPREPLLERDQLVLDLTRDEVRNHLFDQISAMLSDNRIGYVKWDHNRELLEAGSGLTGGAPAVHQQTLGFYRLLDDLRERHPGVQWETCASGGGRIDLGVLDRAERVWTSDMTDALARQSIQRWTGQLVPSERLGAHVSAPTSHQTHRAFSLDFRAATALFGAFGIEWDITRATEDDLDRLQEWVSLFQRFRPLLHTGRVIRVDPSDPAVQINGVIAADRGQALIAHVQLAESAHNRGVAVRLPGLEPERRYTARWVGPVDSERISYAPNVHPDGPARGAAIPGSILATHGLWIPRRRAETILLMHLQAVG